MISGNIGLYASRVIFHLADPALRSILLAGAAALLLRVFRVRNLVVRLAVWTGVLYAALAMPVLGWLLPATPVQLSVRAAQTAQFASTSQNLASQLSRWTHTTRFERVLQAGRVFAEGAQRAAANLETKPGRAARSARSDFLRVAANGFQSEMLRQAGPRAVPVKHGLLGGQALSRTLAEGLSLPVLALAVYTLVLVILLGRLVVGLLLTRRLLRGAPRIDDPRAQRWLEWHTLAMGLRRAPILVESRAVSVPLTLGVLHPSVLIPSNWREWQNAKLAAVIAHEVAHVKRNDPRTKALALIHRCFFWFSPLSWWLEHQLATLVEQASDQAAISAGTDPIYYAEVLMSFFAVVRQGQRRVNWQGVSMARSRSVLDRIDRVLSSKATLTGRSKKPLLLLGIGALPIVYLAATMRPRLEGASPLPLAASAVVTGTQIAAPPAPPAPPPPSPAVAALGAKPGPVPAPPPRPAAMPEPPAPQIPDAARPPQPPGTAVSAGSIREDNWNFGGGQEGMEFAIVSGDSIIVNGSRDDRDTVRSLRKKISGDFIWFIHDGKSYVVRDAATVDTARKLYAPQQELGKKQEALGKQQEELGKQQEALGRDQEAVRVQIPNDLEVRLKKVEAMIRALGANASQEDLGRLQGELGDIQGEIGNLQGKAGNQQGEIGRRQGELGRKQGELGRLQGELGREQGRIAREAARQMQTMLKHALDAGLAQRAPE